MSLLNHVTGILFKPQHEWSVIKKKSINTNKLFTGYVAILALIPVVATFISNCFIGVQIPFFPSYRIPILNGIIYAVISYILAIICICVSAFIINALAPNFGSKQNMNNALKLVAFSYTPIWIAGIFSLYPPLAILGTILSLYALYLLYIGLGPVMGTPASKKIIYFIVSLLVLIVVFVVMGAIIGIVTYTPYLRYNN
jgi:hypothetical protein